jgi:hypothetical protein
MRLIALAELACTENRDWNVGLLGAASYRAGQFEKSLECFAAKEKAHGLRAWDMLFLAMAHHGLGHGDEAQAWLAKAASFIELAGDWRLVDPVPPASPWESWQEEAVARALRAEAEALIGAAK